MNPVPWLHRFVAGWPSIQAQVNAAAYVDGRPLYSRIGAMPDAAIAPTAYRFDGWGVVFTPLPTLACNVKYFAADGTMLDLGRVVGS